MATGVSYRRLTADGLDRLVGRGVYYGADATEASQCAGDDVYIVGAANSAGQAALNIARFAQRVVLVVRRPSLAETMSQYLLDRISAAPNIEVQLPAARWWRPAATEHLEAVTIADRERGVSEEWPATWLFVFIGAAPRTEWLGAEVVRDRRGLRGHRTRATRRRRRLLVVDPGAVRAGDQRARASSPPATCGSTR